MHMSPRAFFQVSLSSLHDLGSTILAFPSPISISSTSTTTIKIIYWSLKWQTVLKYTFSHCIFRLTDKWWGLAAFFPFSVFLFIQVDWWTLSANRSTVIMVCVTYDCMWASLVTCKPDYVNWSRTPDNMMVDFCDFFHGSHWFESMVKAYHNLHLHSPDFQLMSP